MTGKVVSFYSFKGGVGRTMAMANVAFIAALNHKRTLVVDWDLEAPGLHYYFRGLIDSGVTKDLRECPGILNEVWNWNARMRAAETPEDVTALFAGLEDEIRFENLTTSLIEDDFPIDDCVLDYIGPGNDLIGISPNTKSYESALSEFSWSEFFNEAAGGRVIDAFRQWAANNYDYVFIDSRTGFADDAGVCTVQIPDVVALCFILNRQNIDGVAKVAGVIRTARNEDVAVRCITMRVNQSSSAEESDAFERARRQLSRTGKLGIDGLDYDLRRLQIKTHPIPYYESLSPLTASVAQRDPLSLDFLNLAVELCGTELEIPELSEPFVRRARERLQPTLATSDYLLSLQSSAEPERAAAELVRLLDSARAREIDGEELEEEYVAALNAAAADVSEKVDDVDGQDVLDRLVDLLRDLYRLSPDKWRMLFADSLRRLARTVGVYDLQDEEELAALDELDTVLAGAEVNASLLLRRTEAKRRIARIYLKNDLTDDAARTLADVQNLLGELERSVPTTSDERNEILVSEVDLGLMHGDLEVQQDKIEDGFSSYLEAFQIGRKAPVSGRSELQRIMFDLTVRIATRDEIDVDRRADYAVEAARLHVTPGSIAPSFTRLLKTVVTSSRAALLLAPFVQFALGRETRGSSGTAPTLSGYLGRNVRSVEDLLSLSIEAAEITAADNQGTHVFVVSALSGLIIGSLRSLRRRQDQTSSGLAKYPRNVGTLLELGQRWWEVVQSVLTDSDKNQLSEGLNWLEGSKKGV